MSAWATAPWCHCTGHYTAEDIADNQSSDTTGRLLNGDHASQPHCFGDAWWQLSLPYLLACVHEAGCGVLIVQHDSWGFSAVRPEDPGALPFFDFRKAVINFSAGRRSGAAGWYCRRSCGSGWYGSGGRLCGSCSCAKVAAVPGAVGPAVKAWRAADSSPWWTRCRARSRRLASLLLLVGMSGLGCC